MTKPMTAEARVGPKRARYKLKTIGGILSELGATYREYTRGEITASQAMTRKALLAEARECVEGGEVERKIAELEAAVAQQSNVAQFRPKIA
jgi:hypothetical protein